MLFSFLITNPYMPLNALSPGIKSMPALPVRESDPALDHSSSPQKFHAFSPSQQIERKNTLLNRCMFHEEAHKTHVPDYNFSMFPHHKTPGSAFDLSLSAF
jgi:hypothetical protein